ncbi:hypothetical protein FM038_019520 [Shewanella eurypsychrophilus]|uniref:Uncharacterized protein n=1 Tax=Shewanella eurypsychrophilus TaxID=2593656 RepID=A0ABX6V9H4_9GAMM|nr:MULTISPECIES: hypothetical protein [Shewanella]QFU24120.1 hypothetical protein FS418_21245 [Shewanella sp. YLB-09]QPG59327.1 hypothetical protein FM038_019520 [Shewanella eurypsychrophilus]
MMLFVLVVNVLGGIVIAIKTRGNLPYLLFGNFLFFIVFVFSITTVSHHDCSHHEGASLSESEYEFQYAPEFNTNSAVNVGSGHGELKLDSGLGSGVCESCR